MAMTGFMEESLLALFCFDAENGKRVRNMVPDGAWDGIYKNVAAKAAEYWDQFDGPPGEHTLDFFADLKSEDKSRAKQYDRLYESIQETRESINAKYVLGKVADFLREQRLRRGIIDAVDALDQGKPKDAEQIVRKSLEGVLDVFHPGLLFHDVKIGELLSRDNSALPTGIPMLDERSLGPTPGELHLFIAPPSAGKSWWLVHLAKHALAAHKRVVHVTLEMSERRVAQRFVQAFCAVTKRREKEVTSAYFKEDDSGQLVAINSRGRQMKSFDDEGIEPMLAGKIKKFRRRSPLVIRQFPTGQLTVRELSAYLDSLEAQQRIVPDLICLDYADLMSLDVQDYRIALGSLYKDLRGLAVERNIAIATASQTNREYAGKRLITGRGVAEDYSKIATCDTIITYNQTEAEMRLGTARLYVDKGRNEEAKFSVMIAQSYKTGQFCLRSRRMAPRYWSIVDPDGEKKGRERL